MQNRAIEKRITPGRITHNTASGLNVTNKVLTSNVNKGLVNATKYAANQDYFTFGIDSALAAEGHTIANVAAKYSNVKTTAGTAKASGTTPAYPAQSNSNHLFSTTLVTALGSTTKEVTYPLSRVGTTSDDAAKAYTQTNSFTNLVDSVPFTINDPLAKPVSAGDAANQEVVGLTSSTGTFNLLAGQSASFDDKFVPNSFVRVYQSQNLGAVQTNGTAPISFKSVSNNNVGNYYVTSYSVQDNHSSTWIQEKKQVDLTYASNANIYAKDKSDNTDNCFYFSDYGDNNNNETAAMTVTFYNDVAVGDIEITKAYTGGGSPTFYFDVEFAQIFGDTSDVTEDLVAYPDITYDVVEISTGNYKYKGLRYGSTGIAIKPGQKAIISGVPVETRYKVTERTRANSTLTNLVKTIKGPDGAAIAHAVPTHGYQESFNEAQLTSSGRMGTSNNSETIGKDVYYVNMIPCVSESAVNTTDYKTTSSVAFTNSQTMIKVVLKYYDRYVTNGGETEISSDPTSYTYRITKAEVDAHSTGENQWYFYNEGVLDHIAYDKIVTYVTGKANLSNVIADYTFWPTNSQARSEIAATNKVHYNGDSAETQTYGQKYTSEELKYHTDYIGDPVSSSSRGDMWVSFKNSENLYLDFDDPSTRENYEAITAIEVWGYNYPKKYKITSHNVTAENGEYSDGGKMYAEGGAEYDPSTKEAPAYIVGTGSSNELSNYLYNTRVGGAYWAHITNDMSDEQKEAEYRKVELLNRPSEYFQKYGLTKGYTGEYPAAEREFTCTYDTEKSEKYVFAYWASDIEGKNKITTDYQYGYRITKTMDIYPVFVKGEASEGIGVSITASEPDMYTKGDSLFRRINNIIGVYNIQPNDSNTLMTIGMHAFSNCTELKQISIPSSVTSVGQYAFSGCKSLESAAFLADVSKIEMYTFENCSSLRSVELSDKVTGIGDNAFSKCSALKSFPFDNIITIGVNAFSNICLEKVTLSSSVSKLNFMSFSNCQNLTFVEIPKSVSYVPFNTFKNDSSLVLGVWYDSYALEYAKSNSISYTLLDGVKLGDVNGDDDIDITDVTTIQKYLAELDILDGIYKYAADTNIDGEIDISDATAIQMYSVKLLTDYPIGEVITQ